MNFSCASAWGEEPVAQYRGGWQVLLRRGGVLARRRRDCRTFRGDEDDDSENDRRDRHNEEEPDLHAYTSFRFFSGRLRTGFPVAAWIAFSTEGVTTQMVGSPTPPQKSSVGTRTVSTFGISAIRTGR
jgi:hypothetical protein